MEQLFVYETQGTVMDAFFRHYLTMKISHIPKQGQVYEEFKLHHSNCEFNGQDRDMDVNFATDFICCICECAVSEGVDMFPQTGTKSDINQTVSCHVETVCLLSKKH